MDRNTDKVNGGKAPMNRPTFMKELIRTIRRTGKGLILGHQGTDMLAIIRMMKEREKAQWYGPMAPVTKVIGEVGSSTVTAKWFSLMGESKRDTLKITYSRVKTDQRHLRSPQTS